MKNIVLYSVIWLSCLISYPQSGNEVAYLNWESIPWCPGPDNSTQQLFPEPFKPSIPRASGNFLDHTLWNTLLKKFVSANGLVNYHGFVQERGELNSYLNYLKDHSPADDAPRAEIMAFYINLYNAATVKLIVDHYPVNSIKEIQNPWDSKWIPIGGEMLSLGEIEHKILRKMDDPRIHFAINCASYSCPKLVNTAFTAEELDAQLDAATLGFIGDSNKNRITAGSLELSQIFQWYKRDFIKNGTLTDYIDSYTEIDIDDNAKISFLKYDWSLNEAR